MLEQFDKVYCLNLLERNDRWEICQENFDKYNINGERFLATKVMGEFLEHQVSTKRLGQIGCALSFCNMIDDAIDNGYKSVVFLEDDFDFQKEMPEAKFLIDQAYDDLPDDWDMLYFGANVVDHFIPQPLQPYSEHLYKLNSAYALHSVAISRQGLLKIRDYFSMSETVNLANIAAWHSELISKFEAIDVFFAQEFQQNNNCFITKELVCLQRPDFSSIEGAFFDYNQLMIERFNRFKNNL